MASGPKVFFGGRGGWGSCILGLGYSGLGLGLGLVLVLGVGVGVVFWAHLGLELGLGVGFGLGPVPNFIQKKLSCSPATCFHTNPLTLNFYQFVYFNAENLKLVNFTYSILFVAFLVCTKSQVLNLCQGWVGRMTCTGHCG